MKKKTQLTRNLCTFIAKTRMNLFSCFCVYLDFRKFGIIFFVLCFRSFAAFYSLDVSSNVTIPSSLFFPHFIYSTLFLASPTFLYSFFFLFWMDKKMHTNLYMMVPMATTTMNKCTFGLFISFFPFSYFFFSRCFIFLLFGRAIFFFFVFHVCTMYAQNIAKHVREKNSNQSSFISHECLIIKNDEIDDDAFFWILLLLFVVYDDDGDDHDARW